MSNTLNFDESFYLSQNPDVAAAISRGIFTSGAQHYQLNGRFEGRNPNAFFNTSFYLGQYPDVAKAGINPLTHFLNFGVLENRAVNAAELNAIDKDGNGLLNEFNAQAYLAANADVAAAVTAGTFKTAYQHFIQFGQFEGRAAPLTNGTTVTGPFTNAGVGGSTFSLTTGIDNLVGTSGNDTFNANLASGGTTVFGALDKIDGGAGIDTLNITDTLTAGNAALTLPAGFSVTNVERVNVTTNGGLTIDTTGFSGVTTFAGVAAGSANSTATVSNTTTANLTVAGTATATVNGGTAVTVNAGAGTATVTGSALTNVVVNGSAGAAIDNTSAAAVSATGTTLTSVTLAKVDGDSTIKGQGLASVTISGATANANTITVTNAKANHAVAVNVDGTGYKANGTAAVTTFVDANAQSITVNATGAKSNVSLAGSSAATTITTTGSADLALATGSIGTVTKIDGSASTGALTLGALNAATVNVATGSGADSFAINATTKVAVDAGAGNDIVTLTSAIAAGSTINLGAGDDVLLGTTAVAASTSSATTLIDGGAGIDSVSTNLLNAGNAAQFVNFEKLSLGTNSFDASLLTKSTITGLSIDGASSATISNLTTSQGLVVNADNTGNTNTLSFSNASGTTDSYDISFNAKTTGTTAAPATVSAGTLSIQGIETVNIHSNAAAGIASNSITLTDDNARSVVIDGSQALTLAFSAGFGSSSVANSGVSSINGSAATGALSINLANVTAASGGLTVTGGSAADTITTSTFAATLTGNGGADKFVVAASLNTGQTVDATITDFTKGDSITFAGKGTDTFTAAKLDVSSATTLEAAVTTAAAGDGANAGIIKWFQYGGNTYLVEDRTDGAYAATTDQVVKLTGLVDLSTATLDGANHVLTY